MGGTSTAQPALQVKLDLRKKLVLDLTKKKGLEGQKAQVVLVLDFSGSMSHLYGNGSIQDLVERILPVGMAFDDNAEVDFYLFHQGVIELPETLKMSNIPGYINSKIIGKYQMGTTNYAPVIKTVTKKFSKHTTKGGFLGIGGKTEYMQQDLPTYVIFITDGNCDDRAETEEAIREASKTGVFFQFIGIGSAGFPFLEKLDNLSGRNIDNANFFTVKDLQQKSDDELYNLLLTEFPSYVKEARQKGLIK
jgi:hypothetical protein